MTVNTQNAKLLLTRKEAAEMASVSLRTMDSLIAARAVAVVRIGGAVRISAQALQRFIESRTVAAVA